MTAQHPTAIIGPAAEIGSGVEIGPYCVIGPNVRLGDNCRLHSHVIIDGNTEVGAGCQIFPFASLGLVPQDLKYRGEPSRLVIGENNVIREYVTMNPGTEVGGMVTQIGSNCLFMVHAHVAHDGIIGDRVILANHANLAGHCSVADNAILGGISALHQFVRVGEHAFIGGMSGAETDVIPFGMVTGLREGLAGLNLVGMKRHGFSRDQIQGVRKAYKMLFGSEGPLRERAERLAEAFPGNEAVARIVAFIRADSSRAVMAPK